MKIFCPYYCRLVPIILFFGSILFACNKAAKDKNEIKGRFINQTYLMQIPDSVAGLVSAYCYELNFVGSDSVKISYGYEDAILKYKKEGRHYELIDALQNKNMTFDLNDDGTITLSDSISTGSKNSVFARPDSTKQWDFENYLNEKMISGEYVLYKNGQPTSEKIIFSPEGMVTGLSDFTSYTVCYSGDCVGETYPVSNNITFSSDRQSNTIYAFNSDRKSMSLRIYNIEQSIPDTKGERGIKELAFDLRRR